MTDYDQWICSLDEFGLGSWRVPLEPLIRSRFADRAHGDIGKWRAVIDQLPIIAGASARLNTSAVAVAGPPVSPQNRHDLRELLLQLRPWRKGPFNIHGIDIDTEWRSDLKWERIRHAITPLTDRRILDVGCGNGYFALRMLGDGAKFIVGIDPTLLFVFQFFAIKHFLGAAAVHILPLRLHELPDTQNRFDTTFSMGVLYHQRDPLEHLAQLRQTLRPGGELVLETLIIPGAETHVRKPENRYARMRNIWHLPTVAALEGWLQQAGFRDIRLVDITVTTVGEQRSTEWMSFESLAEALDPDDASRTIEGWPVPTRAVIISKAP